MSLPRHRAVRAQLARSGMPLAAGEVEVWVIELDEMELAPELTDVRDVLSEAERARAARLHDSSERRLFELGRGCLRTILAGYTGTTAKEIVLSTHCRHCHASDHGKPLMTSPTDARLDFNASRAGRVLAVVVAAGVSVGIDIEFLSRTSDWEAIAPLLLSSRERRELGLLPRAARSRAVLCSWVCKEALLKATGHGFSVDPRTVALSQRPDGPPIVLAPPPGTKASAWSICSFTTGEDGLVAVAVLGHVAGLTLRPVLTGTADATVVLPARTAFRAGSVSGTGSPGCAL